MSFLAARLAHLKPSCRCLPFSLSSQPGSHIASPHRVSPTVSRVRSPVSGSITLLIPMVRNYIPATAHLFVLPSIPAQISLDNHLNVGYSKTWSWAQLQGPDDQFKSTFLALYDAIRSRWPARGQFRARPRIARDEQEGIRCYDLPAFRPRAAGRQNVREARKSPNLRTY